LVKEYWKTLAKKIRRVKLNPNSFTFFFFLLVSAIFWFFNALNKDYVATIKVPLKFLNFPENKLVAGDFLDHVDVRVSASGYSFLKYNSASFDEAEINLKLYSIHKIPETKGKKFYLLTSTIENEIVSLLNEEMEIRNIEPDSIVFELDEVIKKKVPINRNFLINYRRQYMLNGNIDIMPDSIFIKGVQSVLDTINSVNTQTKVYNDVYDSLEFNIELDKISGVWLSKEIIKCVVPVEEFAELSFVLPIEIENKPENLNLKLFPSEAKVICNVGFSQYRQVFKQQFRFTVDYHHIKNNPDRIKLNLDKFPENVSSVRYYPISVEYLVEEND